MSNSVDCRIHSFEQLHAFATVCIAGKKMIVGMGFDLTELSRIQKSYERFGKRFLRKIYTTREIDACPSNPAAYLAARFAAKEAAVKALGTGFALGISPTQIEITNQASGKPELIFLGTAKKYYQKTGATNIHVSLSHDRNTAGAVVILERLA